MFSDILLTVDYDRTLTGVDSTIPQRNLDAIRYFTEHGGSFTVNTGRSTTTMGDLLHTIPVNAPFLLYNGSAAWENGALTLMRPIDMDLWQTIGVIAEAFPELNLEIQAVDNHYLVNEKPEYVAYYDGIGWPHAPAVPGTDIGPFLKFSLFGQVHGNGVKDMFSATEEDLALFARAEAFIREYCGDKVEIFRAAPRIIDVHAKGVSKINAARALQQRLGKKILVCVGDAENDISMLDGADYAYCPADGVVADRYENVCKCDDGAIADVIYNKIPDILKNKP